MNQLEAFVQIVNLGTFTKASESLFVPQPTLSLRIQQLEKELNIQLFDRHRKNVSLTTAGDLFFIFATNTLQSLENIQSILKESNDAKNATLNIGFPYSYGQIIAGLIPFFLKQMPQVKLSFFQTRSDQAIKAVKNRTQDICITLMEIPDTELAFELIVQQPIQFIVSPSHPLASNSQIELKNLSSESLILFKRNGAIGNIIESTFQQHKIPYRPYIETDNLQIIKSLVQTDQVATLLPQRLVADEILTGQLCAIPVKSNPFNEHKSYLVYSSSNHNNLSILDESVALIKQYFAQTQQQINKLYDFHI